MNSSFTKGLKHGIPIALGYFSVSFGFGIMAVQSGLTIFQAVMISLTNLTSAGQAAAVQPHPCATQMQKSPFLPSPRQSLLFSHRMLYLNSTPGPD